MKALLLAVLTGLATSLWAGNTLTLEQVEINRSRSRGVSPLPPVAPTVFIPGTGAVGHAKKPAKPVKHVGAPVISHPIQPPVSWTGVAGSVWNDDGVTISGGMGGVEIFGASIVGSMSNFTMPAVPGMVVIVRPDINMSEGVALATGGAVVNMYGNAVLGVVIRVQP